MVKSKRQKQKKKIRVDEIYHFRLPLRAVISAVARMLTGVYSYIHDLPDSFLFQLINLNLMKKEIRWVGH
mgnify:FL=1